MSNVRTFGTPMRRARYAAPTAPPDGPENAMSTGRSFVDRALIVPPSERTMFSRPLNPASPSSDSRPSTYLMTCGCV